MSLMLRNPDLYYGNGRRRRVGRLRAPRRNRGGGFLDSLKSAHNWIKNNKIISTVSGALSGVPGIGGIASAINKGSLALGYGRRRPMRRRRMVRRVTRRRMPMRRRVGGRRRVVRRRVTRRRVTRRRVTRRRVTRRRRGGSLRSLLSSAHSFIKSKRLVSGALNHFGHPKLASAASSLGYGRRRVGGANFFSTSMLAVPRFN